MARKSLVLFNLSLIVLLIGYLSGCSKAQPPDNVSLQLNWFHAAEFVGYYMADAKGFYRDEHIKATIYEGGPNIQARESILDGSVDFAISSFEEQKKLVEQGRPSVAVMAAFQIPPLVIFSLADSGIREPRDLIGKRVGIKNSYWRGIVHSTLANAGIDPSKIIEVQVPIDAQSMLYDRQVDVWMGYAHDELVRARLAGYDIAPIFPADYGVGGYEGLLLVNLLTINQRLDTVSRFVRASQKGLEYALENADEAAEVLAKWQPKDNLEFYKMAMSFLIPLTDDPRSKVGAIDPVRWAHLMESSYDVAFPGYTMQFLQGE